MKMPNGSISWLPTWRFEVYPIILNFMEKDEWIIENVEFCTSPVIISETVQDTRQIIDHRAVFDGKGGGSEGLNPSAYNS